MTPREILGVGPQASKEECQKAFRKLARQYHPDLHPGDRKAEERFKAVSQAWEQVQRPPRVRHASSYRSTYQWQTGPTAQSPRMTGDWKATGSPRQLQGIINELHMYAIQRGLALRIQIVSNTSIKIHLEADANTIHTVNAWLLRTLGPMPPRPSAPRPPRPAPRYTPPEREETHIDVESLIIAITIVVLSVMLSITIITSIFA